MPPIFVLPPFVIPGGSGGPGRQQIEFRTNDMIYGVERYVAEISKYITLSPGDVIWMGTEGANAAMHAGDVIEIEIDQIGTLRNPVAAEER